MSELQTRFGRLVAAHRRRVGMTQQQLAEAVDASVYMISKIESGASGTRFAMIERLSSALEIDPAELFTADLPRSALQQSGYGRISRQLLELEPDELEWIGGVIEAALKSRRKS
ncbi:helix-turn-helix domain-containing protein [Alkalicaulis satelles]|uniref:Helix-turn-helix domain-containing protein n=1 Tax=Alkalicaulis satelles TaxID=2609175 RepID=A0A5M6ZFS1_9PROT|nr:helix-turn-helix transcriptional regulator [Alkalicaulis satelles]KAA5803593.1 helix-turn-helix domain-containing protein [Alkalicaulis satelles]